MIEPSKIIEIQRNKGADRPCDNGVCLSEGVTVETRVDLNKQEGEPRDYSVRDRDRTKGEQCDSAVHNRKRNDGHMFDHDDHKRMYPSEKKTDDSDTNESQQEVEKPRDYSMGERHRTNAGITEKKQRGGKFRDSNIRKLHTGEEPCDYSLRRRKQSHAEPSTYVVPEAANVGNVSGTKRRKKPPGEKPYKCGICNTGFSRSSHLVRHSRIHTGDKPYECEECGARFADKSSMMSHQTIHTGEKPHKCFMCGTGFADKSNMFKHQRIHTGIKPHKCDVCGMGFSRASHLTSHKRIHTGEKLYKCDVCLHAFSQRGNMVRHKRKHTDGVIIKDMSDPEPSVFMGGTSKRAPKGDVTCPIDSTITSDVADIARWMIMGNSSISANSKSEPVIASDVPEVAHSVVVSDETSPGMVFDDTSSARACNMPASEVPVPGFPVSTSGLHSQ